MLKTLCVFGTRPEAIKMAPVIGALNNEKALIHNQVCVTGQHQEMLNSILQLFSIVPDFNLGVMSSNQTLTHLTNKVLKGMSDLFTQFTPDLVLVQGDTTTTLATSLAAYYHKIPIAHIEAGLRTGELYAPWPEEANRKLTGHLATLHFAPTLNAKENLLREGIDPHTIHVTGNTVIDALYQMAAELERSPTLVKTIHQQFPMLHSRRKMVLVTGHRRENFGSGFERICHALVEIARKYPEVDIIYPVHLNPNVQVPVKNLLGNIPNIHLIEPVDYLPFVYLMKSALFILTDSGGIQEEAPALGKPVLVMRETTERPEAIDAGTVLLVGTDVVQIVNGASRLLDDEGFYQHMAWAHHPYGDGEAARRIVEIIISSVEAQSTFTRARDKVTHD